MKTIQIIFLVFVSYMLFQANSCNTIKENDLNAEVAKLGVSITDNGVQDIRNIQNLDRYFKFNRRYAGILSSHSNDSIVSADSSSKSTKELLASMVALNKVYQSYFMFADKGILPEETKFAENIKAAVEIMEVILPTEKDELKKIKDAAGSRRFNEKTVMFHVNSLFLKYFETEFAIQNQKFAGYETQYENQIQRVPETAFDPQKLSVSIKEPVKGDILLVEVYKLQLINEASNKVEDMNHSLDLAIDALTALNRMHAEFMKKKPDRNVVENMIIRTQNIYPAIELKVKN